MEFVDDSADKPEDGSSLFGRKTNKEDSSPSEAPPTLPETPYARPNLYPSLNPSEVEEASKNSLPYVLVPEGVEVRASDTDVHPPRSKPCENSDPLQSIPVTLVVDLDNVNLDSFDSEFRNFSSILLSIMETDQRQDYDYDFSLEKRILKEEQQINAVSE